MSADLALLAANTEELEVSDDPGRQIVLACQRANAWLKAGIEVRIETIVEAKAQAAALATFAVQKQLGKDAELAALEVQRRAERGVGLAIRAGQVRGEIAKRGDVGAQPSVGVRGAEPGLRRGNDLVLPSTIVPGGNQELSDAIYPITDGVSEDDFDAAIEDAKSEKNLSRANVIRKIKGDIPRPLGRPEHLRGTHHLNSNRIIGKTVADARPLGAS